jgi:PIN domain nuclease of toxin-antitoxin system
MLLWRTLKNICNMNLLLDTHTFIWFLNGDKKLPKYITNIIADIDNKCFLSIASLWEISIKTSLGKLTLMEGFNKISEFIINNDIDILPITFEQLQILLKLKYHHRDPFDRILISQGITENFLIATNDKSFNKYSVKTIWK